MAARRPDAEAVRLLDQALTYAELEKLSNQLAHALIEIGVVTGDRIGIYLHKSPSAIASIFVTQLETRHRCNLTSRANPFTCSSVDPSRTWEQIAFHHSVCDFARQELHRGADERDRAGRFPTKAWKKCAEFGIFLLHLAVKDCIVAVCLDF